MRKINNILVTGGAGFIGSSFIRFILSLEDFKGKIINYDLLTYAGNLQNVKSIENDKRYNFVKADICDTSFLEKICNSSDIDTIVHFAAETHVDNSIEGPKAFLQTNVIGTFSILEVVRRNPHIHLHHISTDEVYGELGEVGFFNEETKYNPSSPYSASKAASDHFVLSYYRTYGISVTLSHCTNNYGPFQHVEKLIPLMITNAIDGKKLPIYGEGKNVRDWLYVDDHAEAIWIILKKGKNGEVYDIGGGVEKTNFEVVDEILQILSKMLGTSTIKFTSLIEYVEDRPGHDFRYAIDISKIDRELGWMPKYNFTDGIRKTISWYQDAKHQDVTPIDYTSVFSK